MDGKERALHVRCLKELSLLVRSLTIQQLDCMKPLTLRARLKVQETAAREEFRHYELALRLSNR